MKHLRSWYSFQNGRSKYRSHLLVKHRHFWDLRVTSQKESVRTLQIRSGSFSREGLRSLCVGRQTLIRIKIQLSFCNLHSKVSQSDLDDVDGRKVFNSSSRRFQSLRAASLGSLLTKPFSTLVPKNKNKKTKGVGNYHGVLRHKDLPSYTVPSLITRPSTK